MHDKSKSRRINILRDSVALRIAAGEVIDRPFSVVRELIDNSVDSGADSIEVYVENGGIDRIRVVDNGSGISPEDLKLCYLPHATSKISEMEDLDFLSTMGFRGEALSSIAASAKLSITSKTDINNAHRITVHGSSLIDFREVPGNAGTVADVSDLFYSVPARRKFLKKPASESAACKKVFIEKALAFPEISMKFYSNGSLKLYLPASSRMERILSAFPNMWNRRLLEEVQEDSQDFKITFIAGTPSLHRSDRKYMQIYLNNRRINEFSLIQALEYGFSEYLPGGNYPVVFLFIDIEPGLIDFNIHPAKKEVRFRDLPSVHRAVVNAVKSHLASHDYKYSGTSVPDKANSFEGLGLYLREHRNSFSASAGITQNRSAGSLPVAEFPVEQLKEDIRKEQANFKFSETELPVQYKGQIFRLFLLAEIDRNFYFIDQHAAHEKLLFNELKSRRDSTQELLIPYVFDTSEQIDKLLSELLHELDDIGFSLERTGDCAWQLISVPGTCSGKESIIVDFLTNLKGTPSDLETELYADIACKAAIKDGDFVDSTTALELIKRTLLLENARCPHGRPVWFQISRDELFKFVGRL